MRKKKTPEELAAEAEQEDLDDFTSNSIFFLSIFPHFGILHFITAIFENGNVTQIVKFNF